MRVAMIIQSYHPHIGGAERQLAALARPMMAHGIDLRILTRRYDLSLASFEEIDGVPVYRLPTPGPKAMASLSFTLSAQANLLKFKPDIIHAHELLSPATTAVLAKLLQRTPVVAKVLTGGAYGDVWKLQHRWSGRTRAAIFSRQIDRFIAISHEIDTELANIGIPIAQRSMIPNGVDVERFSPVSREKKRMLRQTLELPPGPIAIFSGRLTRQKRLDLLLQAWQDVRVAHPEATLLILGTGEEEALLRGIANGHASDGQRPKHQSNKATVMDNGIRFLGRTEDVAPYLQAADLFVLPSSAEGLSNSLLEAMATGLPGVVTNVGAAPELIESNKNGWIIPPGDARKITEALCNAFLQFDLLPMYGANARDKVVSDYSLSSVVERLIGLYTELINRRQPVRQPSIIEEGTK